MGFVMGRTRRDDQKLTSGKPKSLPARGPRPQTMSAVEGSMGHFPKKYGYAFLLAIVVLAIFLRVYDIGAKDVWLDEANTVLIAENGPSGIVTRLADDANPPLFYFLLHGWLDAFGKTEAALRGLSALFGILLVIAVYFIGRRIFSERVGVYAALIASIAPIQVMYSQQIRMYTLLPLTALMSMYCLLRFIREGKRSSLAGYGIFTILSIYTHNHGIFLLPAHALSVLVFARQRRVIIGWSLCIVCVAALYAFWIPSLLGQMEKLPRPGWMEDFWNLYGFGGSLLRSFLSFSPGGPQPIYMPLNPMRWLPILPVLTLLFLLIAGLTPLIRKGSDRWKTGVIWLVVYGFIPLVFAGLASYFLSRIYIPGRSDQLVFPAFCLLAAIGIQQTRPVFLRLAAVALIAVCSLLTLYDYYQVDLKAGNKLIAQSIRRQLVPGDAILCTSLTRAPLEYYLREERPLLRFYSYPHENENHLGHEDTPRLLRNPSGLIEEARLLLGQIRNHSPNGRCFVVYVPSSVNRYLEIELRRNVPVSQMTTIGRFKQSLRRLPALIVLVRF
jgi:mannosyltransferase